MYHENRHMKPSEIRFTQDSIARVFRNKESVNRSVRKIKKKEIEPSDFPPIEVFFLNDKIYSLDNRRLYVFRVCELRGLLSTVKVIVISYTRYHERKFTTKNDGLTIFVKGGGTTRRHCRSAWLSTTPVKPKASIQGSFELVYQPTSRIPNPASREVTTRCYSSYTPGPAPETMKYGTVRPTITAHEQPSAALVRAAPVDSRRSHISVKKEINPMKKESALSYIINDQDCVLRNQLDSKSEEIKHSKAGWLPTSVNGRCTVSSDEDEEDYSAHRLERRKGIRTTAWVRRVRLDREQSRIDELLAGLELQDSA